MSFEETPPKNGVAMSPAHSDPVLVAVRDALRSLAAGDLDPRLPVSDGADGVLDEIAAALHAASTRARVLADELEQLRATRDREAAELALASKRKSEFLASMSHELRTPLNSLLILSRLLADDGRGTLTDKQLEWARSVHASGNDLLALVNEIVELAKVEGGGVQLDPRDVPFGRLVASLERAFRPVAERSGLTFEAEMLPGAPASIRTDPDRLRQVLDQLLANAFRFTERGSVRLVVGRPHRHEGWTAEGLGDPGDVVAFSVIDTGVGIPADQLELVFAPFRKADRAASSGGTGLGLTIGRELARGLGGEIRVESEPGRGSTFTLYLPDAPSAGAVAAPRPRRAELPRPSPASRPAPRPVPRPASAVEDDRHHLGRGDRVLLVIEDDLSFARILAGLAREQGFKVVVEARGDSGVAMADELQPDAITLDVRLPVVDGWSALERLKRNPRTRHIPVHVISAVDDPYQAATLGAIACVEKPVSRDAVQDALARVSAFLDRQMRRLLVVEDDPRQRQSVVELLQHDRQVDIVAVGSAAEALRALEEQPFDCIVCDLMLPDSRGTEGLEQIKSDERFRQIPIVVYTGKELTLEDEQRLRRYAASVILKGESRSPDRLLDDTALFLHRVVERLPPRIRRAVETESGAEISLDGRHVLVVDDDRRNVFAITSVLETFGMIVSFAETGADAMRVLEERPVDLVLMDVRMPEMDGYAATRQIRTDPRFFGLPILAITGMALEEDREKCIAAGASDYLSKPIDADRLLAKIRMWLRT